MSNSHTTSAHTANATQDTRWLTATEQTLWRTWLNVHSQINTALARQLSQSSSLSLPDYEVLVQLSESEGGQQRITALADRLQWDRSRLSHQITRMTKRGLVRRETCEDDGRGAFVILEEEGKRSIADAAPGHVRQVQELLFDPLNEQECTALLGILQKLDAQFDNPLLEKSRPDTLKPGHNSH